MITEGQRGQQGWVKLCTNHARRNPGVRFRIWGFKLQGRWLYRAERIEK